MWSNSTETSLRFIENSLPHFHKLGLAIIQSTLFKMPLSERLKDEDIEKLKTEFLELDADGDGTITIKELGAALRSMRDKLKLSETDIKRALRSIDKDGDGTINLEEYQKNLKNSTTRNLIHRVLVERSAIRKQFVKFDLDGSGYITMDEIKQVFEKRTGGQVDVTKIQKVLKDVDKDKDGKINYDEFVFMMSD